jgi:hypothetical protein
MYIIYFMFNKCLKVLISVMEPLIIVKEPLIIVNEPLISVIKCQRTFLKVLGTHLFC